MQDSEIYYPWREKMIICDGCHKQMSYVGEVHEILHNIEDRFPELCGYGVEIDGDRDEICEHADWIINPDMGDQ